MRLNSAWLAPGVLLQAPAGAGDAAAGFVVLSGNPLLVPVESLLTMRVRRSVRARQPVGKRLSAVPCGYGLGTNRPRAA